MLGLTLEHDVDHASDRVRAILGRRAVPQHLDALDRRRRDRVEIDPHSAPAERAVYMDERARVASLAIDQHQNLIGTEAPEARGIHMIRPIGDRLMRGIERGFQCRKHLVHFGHPRLGHFLRRDHVHRDRRLGGGARRAGADHDHFVEGERRGGELEIDGDRLPRGHDDALLRRLVANEPGAHVMRAGRDAQVIQPLLVGEHAPRRPDDHHACPGERRARLGRHDGPGHCTGLLCD